MSLETLNLGHGGYARYGQGHSKALYLLPLVFRLTVYFGVIYVVQDGFLV